MMTKFYRQLRDRGEGGIENFKLGTVRKLGNKFDFLSRKTTHF